MKIRKLLLILLSLTLLPSFAACGKEPELVETEATKELIRKESVYPFEAGYTIAGIARIGDTLLAAGQGDGEAALCIMRIGDGGTALEAVGTIALGAPETAGGTELWALSAGEDGLFYLLTGEAAQYYLKNGERLENEDYQGRYILKGYDEAGALVSEIEINAWPFEHATGVAVGTSGAIYIYGSYYLATMDSNGALVNYVAMGEDMELNAAVFANGKLVLSCYDYSAGLPLYFEADMEKGILTDIELELPAEEDKWIMGSISKSQGLDGELILSDAFSFFEYDGQSRMIMRWGFMNQYETSYDYVLRTGERAFACTEAGGESISLIWGETLSAVELPIVNVAICGERSGEMQGRVEEFANSSGLYDFRFTVYSEAEMELFKTRLGSGEIPDLVLFDDCLDTVSAQFDDLYTYIDNDPDISREDFIPNLLSALEVKGELHELWTGVRLDTVLLREEDARRLSQMSPAEFYQSVLAEEERYPLFGTEHMQSLARIAAAEFVDRSNGECSFDDEAFALLLQTFKQLPAVDIDDVRYMDMEEIISFYQCPILEFAEDRLNSGAGDWEFTGLPGCPSGGNYYSCGSAGRAIAIPSGSQNKEGAWAYIKYELSLSSQLKQPYNIHVTNEAFERDAAARLSEENYAKLMALLQGINKCLRFSDRPLEDIILEAMNAYAAGDKSLEETIDLIQGRAGIYIAEQFG